MFTFDHIFGLIIGAWIAYPFNHYIVWGIMRRRLLIWLDNRHKRLYSWRDFTPPYVGSFDCDSDTSFRAVNY